MYYSTLSYTQQRPSEQYLSLYRVLCPDFLQERSDITKRSGSTSVRLKKRFRGAPRRGRLFQIKQTLKAELISANTVSG